MPKVKKIKSESKHPIKTWKDEIPSSTVGQIIFAKCGTSAWWPGIVVDETLCGQRSKGNNHEWVYWYGDGRVSHVPHSKICSFRELYFKLAKENSSKTRLSSIEKALKDCAAQDGRPASDSDTLQQWALSGFPPHDRDKNRDKQDVQRCLKTSCIACRDTTKKVWKEHPLFHGGICEDCEICLKRYMFALDEDGLMVVCSVCGNSGELLICDKPGCCRVYCIVCIVELISEEALIKLRQENPWICFLCRDFDEFTNGLLYPRQDWWENVTRLFAPSTSLVLSNIIPKKDKGIRVLSLFDGISAGYYALSKLKIAVDCYYASEVDEKAMTVSKYNFPGKILYIGDIECVTPEKIAELGPIDLVIGGSPCNDLSAVNPARKGLYAGDGTGRLFFEFYRVLKTIQEQAVSKENPVFWMYENVASMPAIYREIISRFLGCEPALINAKEFSAQHRPRFFWSSIPGVTQLSEVETNDCPTLSSTISADGMRVATVSKINTVTTQKNSLKKSNSHPVLMNGEASSIWITEVEEVFGFPPHFTDVGNFSTQQRLKLLGKSWSVPVIKNIFSPLRHIFAVEK